MTWKIKAWSWYSYYVKYVLKTNVTSKWYSGFYSPPHHCFDDLASDFLFLSVLPSSMSKEFSSFTGSLWLLQVLITMTSNFSEESLQNSVSPMTPFGSHLLLWTNHCGQGWNLPIRLASDLGGVNCPENMWPESGRSKSQTKACRSCYCKGVMDVHYKIPLPPPNLETYIYERWTIMVFDNSDY